MPARKTLNPKRLTKREVQHLIEGGAIFREDLTEAFSAGNRVRICLIYELSEDRFLLVFTPESFGPSGRGDIYPGDYFRRLIRWCQRIEEDARAGRQGSVGHWWYYSNLRSQLATRIDELIDLLAVKLKVQRESLDYSYRSLDPVSADVERMGIDAAYVEVYDELVAYVGEILRRRVNGLWSIGGYDDQRYPFIQDRHRVLMPINAVWEALSGLEPVDLRKAATAEMRFAVGKYG